ncbi:unnamed protein product [Trifolium pratense]|uniref:Uncharacterized protein n=1 Tax=Trifolium pratense TaxID=57577 RepID=A0ACB0KDW6_TRIPR|nr:unnamed protein product [Trifolium pratense]
MGLGRKSIFELVRRINRTEKIGFYVGRGNRTEWNESIMSRSRRRIDESRFLNHGTVESRLISELWD